MKGRELRVFPQASGGQGMMFAFKRHTTPREFTLRQPQSEERILQSLMIWGGDRAVLYKFLHVYVFSCVCERPLGCEYLSQSVYERMR